MTARAERLREVSTFAMVGVAATLTHLLAAWVAHRLGLAPQGANMAGWLTAVLVSFVGQARLTFRVDGALGPYLPRFLTMSGLAFVISSLVVAGADRADLPFWQALMLVGLTVPPASYLAQRHLVFSRSGETSVDPGQIIAFVTGIAIFAWFRDAYVNHDVAWYLVAGRQWIEGARLYTDLSEVNPPLAFYLMRAALHFGDLFDLAPAASLAAFMATLTTLSLAWVTALTPRDLPRRWLFLTAVAAATTLPFLAHFGQREHIMLILILPWVAAALFLHAPFSGQGAVLRGLVAGVGICLKPHFLVYPALLALFEAIRERSLRPIFAPGNLAMGAVGLAYVAGVTLFHREYFTIIVPDARLVYGAYTLPFDLFLRNLWPLPVTLAVVGLALGSGTEPGPRRALLLFLAALAAYALQGNGFSYHAAPAHALAVIALALMAAQATQVARAIAALGVIALFLNAFLSVGAYRNPLSTPLETQLAAQGIAPERLLVWSPSLLPAFPLALETGADWTGHAASLWLLPGTLDMVENGATEDDPRHAVLRRSREQMARDLARCPDVLIVDRVLPFREAPLDILAYAGSATAEAVRRNYDIVGQDARFDILTRSTPCP
ncbi:hypothetical protein GQ651_12555 [Alphaproteobacteria bacterium GH1-50]|uniref:GtrA/DPMS transmembrane domain-containing protein n=1 Tax=Kangsaoukella pontilimi TaxID=2691042 RepID=A0A7C9NF89_9RHOB|nr:GtrA family protein [Kangsaoukella pontilimi]MXQ08679.1 hypothetical protein [Kangsaoukella pontilimi]